MSNKNTINQVSETKTNGYGRFEFQNGSIYEGQWKLINNEKMKHGEGILVYSSPLINDKNKEMYSGNWKNNKMSGFGVYHYISGCKYKGHWSNNMHNGQGQYFFADGSIYKGEWLDNQMHGEGCFIDRDGKSLNGEFRNGSFQSKLQKKLKIEKIINMKTKLIIIEVIEYLKEFKILIDSNDKNQIELIPNKYFCNLVQDDLKAFYKDIPQTFDEFNLIQWVDILNYLIEDSSINVLKKPSESSLIDTDLISNFEFAGNGQIIEIEKEDDIRKAYMILFYINNQIIIVNFFDSKIPDKK